MSNLFTANKLHSALFLSLLLSPMATLNAAQINADSSIKAVTVYPGSAKITRVSTISLAAGENDIIINNLPLNLNESSLRVSGEGQGNISLGSVELSRDIQIDVVQQREKDLRDKIEETQEARQVIEDSITRNRSQLEYINKMVLGNNTNKRKDEGQSSGYTNLPLDQWLQAWQTLDEATKKVQEQIRLSNQSLKDNQYLLNKLNRELQQVATNQKENRVAKFRVAADIPTELKLNLTYQINGARWTPVYDADLNTENSKIELKTLAQISQRTGEDWKDVDVTLSTLRPSAGTQLPRLNPWVLDFIADTNDKSYRSKGMTMDTMVTEQSAEPMVASPPQASKMLRKPKPIKQQQAQLVSADFSAEFKVPTSIALDSGSNKRRFALNSQKMDTTLKLASAPRFDPRAMILATTKYQDDTPLLAGSMSLYRNGSFVGNTFLSQKLSGEEIKLSFGEDDKVKIKFLPDPDKKRKDGLLFGKKKVVERHYKVSISSNHSKPYPITLSDVLPVAADENIKVKTLGDLPTVRDVDDKKGVYNWDKMLTPNSELKINYGYSVSYPEDRAIMGL